MSARGQKFQDGFAQCQRWLNNLARGGLDRAASKPIWQATQKIHSLVQARYRDLDAGRAQTFSYKAARAGKEAGTGNSRTPRSRAPLDPNFIGMELFARHVKKERRKGVSRVWLSATAIHPIRRVPLTLMAYWMENPSPITVPKSFRSWVYVMLIAEGRGGFGTRRRNRPVPDNPPGWDRTETYIPRPKLVWKYVAEKLGSITKAMWPELAKNIQKLAVQYGATPT